MLVFKYDKPSFPRRRESGFRVRFDWLAPGEKLYLRVMADLGAGPYRSSDVAEKLSA